MNSTGLEGHEMDRNEAIAAIRTALRKRSGMTWSVTGGRGTAWGWIRISAPPARCDEFGGMSERDQRALSDLIGETVHHQGVSIPASSAYRRHYVERAQAGASAVVASPYWD
jgi:hypothetical protein